MTAAGPWDLGDTVRLTAAAVDAAGNAVNCTGMVLTVTLPDGSTAQPAVTNPPTGGTGAYQADFATTQAGHHKVRWVGTTPAFAYTDVFDVLPADPRFVLSLADAREALRKTAAATIDDNELRLYMAAMTPIIEDIAGPQVVETISLTVSGGKSAVLLNTPVVSVVSVTENGVALVEGQDFVVDKPAGIVYRGTQIQPFGFISGHDNVVISYTAANGLIAENVRLAARIILRHLWNADNTGNGRPAVGVASGGGGADVITTPGGYAVPRRAAELLNAARNISLPGFA